MFVSFGLGSKTHQLARIYVCYIWCNPWIVWQKNGWIDDPRTCNCGLWYIWSEQEEDVQASLKSRASRCGSTAKPGLRVAGYDQKDQGLAARGACTELRPQGWKYQSDGLHSGAAHCTSSFDEGAFWRRAAWLMRWRRASGLAHQCIGDRGGFKRYVQAPNLGVFMIQFDDYHFCSNGLVPRFNHQVVI